MNTNINGNVIKKSICDFLGISKKHVQVKLFVHQGISNNYASRWLVFIDGFEMAMWWQIQGNIKSVPLENIMTVTKNFYSEIKDDKVRKFVDGKPITLEVKEIISKLNFEYKLDLLN